MHNKGMQRDAVVGVNGSAIVQKYIPESLFRNSSRKRRERALIVRVLIYPPRLLP